MKIPVLCLAALCAAGSAYAQGSPETFGVEAALVFWKPSPDIVLTSGTLGTPVDFINTFAVEDKRFRGYRFVVKAARKHKIRFSNTPIHYEATTTLTQNIRFRGQTYSVGLPTTAELKWTLMRIGYEWDPIASDMGFVGVFGDLKYNKMNASLSAPLVAQTFERNIAVPTIGGIARVYLSRNLSVTTEFTGIKLDRSDFNAKFYDFDITGTANFGRNFAIEYGYRRLTVDYDIESDVGDLKMKGPYWGLAARF